jgi:terminase large subunit-like protein
MPPQKTTLRQVNEAVYRRDLRAKKKAQALREKAASPILPVSPVLDDWQDAEWQKCAEDIEYFFRTYVKIVDADGELIPFDPYEWQDEFLEAFRSHRRLIGLCARQAGKSQVTTCLALHHVLFSGWKTCAIVANKELTVKELIRRARRSYDLLPEWMKARCVLTEDNAMTLGFANGSRLFGAATSPTSISGQSVTLLIVDETAKIENWPEFWPSTSQTISQSKVAKIIMLSSPWGMNHFQEFCAGAPGNGWHLLSVRWERVPGRDESWKEATIRTDFNGDADAFAAEHELSFTSSGGLLINSKTLDFIQANFKDLLHAQ